jgi:Zinc dependent phospholipase C
MAGAFTHFMICDVAKRSAKLNVMLMQLLNRHSEFLFLGGASPDLPYLSFRTGETNWADVMHYEKTNGIAVSGFAELKNAFARQAGSEQADIQLSWLMGFVSHLVTDATIHPIIQAIVGPYSVEENREPHRISEMTQDALIFNADKGTDIRYGEFSDILKFCRESKQFDAVMEFWKRQASANFPDKDEPHPELWFTTYAEAIELAAAESKLLAMFRHAGGDGSYFYKTKEEIVAGYPDGYQRFFLQVKLPDQSTADFREEGFRGAIANVVDAWNGLYAALTGEGTAVDTIIRPWNLDTGVDMDFPGGNVTYWA